MVSYKLLVGLEWRLILYELFDWIWKDMILCKLLVGLDGLPKLMTGMFDALQMDLSVN